MAKQIIRTMILGSSALTAAWLCDVPTAVAGDASGLTARLERIERDLMVLQRQIYRTKVDGKAPTAVPQAGDMGAASSVVRLGEIEEQIRDLTGQIETLSYNVKENKARMDRMNADIDYRLRFLEGGEQAGNANVNSEQLPSSPATSSMPPNNGKIILTPPSSSGVEKVSKTSNTLQNNAPLNGDPTKEYKAAFNLLQKGKYDAAEGAFQSFLTSHKDSPLAGNAQYWLGETFYVRGQYEKAAVTFADGYKSYRKSPKAADSLLKLGFSMRKLGKDAQSCAAYGQLLKEFPNSSQVIIQLAKTARKELKCP